MDDDNLKAVGIIGALLLVGFLGWSVYNPAPPPKPKVIIEDDEPSPKPVEKKPAPAPVKKAPAVSPERYSPPPQAPVEPPDDPIDLLSSAEKLRFKEIMASTIGNENFLTSKIQKEFWTLVDKTGMKSAEDWRGTQTG